MNDFWAVSLVLLVALAATVVTDLRWRRIPEWITHPLALAGLAFAWHAGGWGDPAVGPSLSSSLVGMAVARELFALGEWLYSLLRPEDEAMGQGDINLLAAIGAVLGWPLIVGGILFFSVAAIVQATLAWLARTSRGRLLSARLGIAGTQDPDFGRYIPLGVSIAAGTAAFRLWQIAHLPPPG